MHMQTDEAWERGQVDMISNRNLRSAARVAQDCAESQSRKVAELGDYYARASLWAPISALLCPVEHRASSADLR